MTVTKDSVPVSKATLKYVRISPFKLRKVADEIRGESALPSLSKMKVFSQKASSVLYNVLKSAIANATSNTDLAAENLFISKIIVNQGPVMKRIQPRARGRAFRIIKPTSHVHIELKQKGDNN